MPRLGPGKWVLEAELAMSKTKSRKHETEPRREKVPVEEVAGPAGAERLVLSTEQAAAALGLQPQTLRSWRSRGCGPAYCLVSKNRSVYTPSSLEEFLRARTAVSTADAAVRGLGQTGRKKETPPLKNPERATSKGVIR